MPIKRLHTNNLRWLAEFPELARIKDTAWFKMLHEARANYAKQSTVMVKRYTQCNKLFLIRSGILRIHQIALNGREIVLYRDEPGNLCILTLTSMENSDIYPAEAIAETDIDYLEITFPAFEKTISDSEGFRIFVMETLTRRLNQIIRLVEDVTFNRLNVRLANTLLRLFENKKSSILKVTHEDLASELGTNREVISKLLKSLEHEAKCIELHRGRIELKSISTLKKIRQKSKHMTYTPQTSQELE